MAPDVRPERWVGRTSGRTSGRLTAVGVRPVAAGAGEELRSTWVRFCGCAEAAHRGRGSRGCEGRGHAAGAVGARGPAP